MTTFKPFTGISYGAKAGEYNNLICPAYDVISEKERENLLQKSEYNFIRIEAPQGKDAYMQAQAVLNEWLSNGILTKDSSPAFFLYQASYSVFEKTYSLRGLLGALRLPDDEKSVLTHENTFDKAKEDRLSLLKATGANTSPIYSLYDDTKGILEKKLQSVFKTEPLCGCQVKEVYHQIWAIKDEDLIQKITEFFTDKQIYIADGHHRYQTALNYRDFLSEKEELSEEHPANYIMNLLCESHCPGIAVLPTHRILKDIPNFDGEALCQAAEDYFQITHCQNLNQGRNKLFEARRQNKNAFLLYADEEYRLFVLKNSVNIRSLIPELSDKSDAFCKLDVVVLHEIVLSMLLNLSNDQISYTRSAKEACSQVDLGDACAAVILSAMRVNELCDIAQAGEKMPQKSTYFYPKPVSGLVFRKD